MGLGEGCAEIRVTRPQLIPQASEARMALQSCPQKRQGDKTLYPHMGQSGDKTAPGKGQAAPSPEGEGAALSADGARGLCPAAELCMAHHLRVFPSSSGRPLRQQIHCRTFPFKPAACLVSTPSPAKGINIPPDPPAPGPPGENMGESCQLQRAHFLSPPPDPSLVLDYLPSLREGTAA